MALTPETEAQILRYHHAEHWPIGTIARQLNLHRDTVARILAQAGLPTIEQLNNRHRLLGRPMRIDKQIEPLVQA